MATFPNVPNVPGVPPLLRAPGVSAPSIILLVADVVTTLLGSIAAPWGIYLDGAPALPARSTVSFDYRQDWRIADYQVEQGGFESYDKVQMPFDVRVRVSSGSSIADRQALIEAVDEIANSLDLFDVYTPEKIYLNCNVSHVDLRRQARAGANLIVYDIWLQEIRETANATFSNTQQPSGADPVAAGNVQATDVAGAAATASLPDGVT